MKFLKMTKQSMQQVGILVVLMLAFGLVNAQEMKDMSDPVKKAKYEMKEMFGTVPMFFEAFPEHALPGVWEYFQQMNSPKGNIPPKYRELLQLAVATNIPCEYCVYFHSAAAEVYGASDAELKEAVAHGAATRHWSMILQGSQADLSEFKDEVDMIFDRMAQKGSN